MNEKVLTTKTSINGRLVRRGHDKISVFDNSLLYAEGLFETLLAAGDRPIFADEHLDRLYRGAGVIGLDIPVAPATLKRWMKKTLSKHPDRVKKLRLTITSGESARYVGRQGKPQIIMSASPHEIPTTPFRLHVSEFRVDQKSVFRIIKTLSYAIHAAALKQARERGCDDALLLNQANQVAEVTSANVFWVEDGRIYTPPIGSGCLEGITRRIVFDVARDQGLKVRERICRMPTLVAADEVFISSSLKLVVGVSSIEDGGRTHRIKTGPITPMLSAQFRRLVGLE